MESAAVRTGMAVEETHEKGMNELPNPLTPPDCDLTGYRWMPLDVVRVIDSDTFGLSTGDEFKTAFRLWAKSWLQVPAASLPDDDRLLAHLAGLELPAWKKRKAISLRGFIKCSDGRLYHPVIAEKALEAMSKREAHAEREENVQSRQERHRERRKEMFERLRLYGVNVAWDAKTAELERLIAALPDTPPVTKSVSGASQEASQNVTENVTGDVTCNAPATANEKDRTGHNSKPKNLEEPVVAHTNAHEDAPAPLVPNSRAAEISLLMRRNGVEGCNPSNPIVIEWAADPRVTDETLLTAASMAKARDVLRPGPNYLAPIVQQLLNPKPARPKQDDHAWKRSPKGIESKASELGIYARAGESHDALRERCDAEIRRRAQGAAA